MRKRQTLVCANCGGPETNSIRELVPGAQGYRGRAICMSYRLCDKCLKIACDAGARHRVIEWKKKEKITIVLARTLAWLKVAKV